MRRVELPGKNLRDKRKEQSSVRLYEIKREMYRFVRLKGENLGRRQETTGCNTYKPFLTVRKQEKEKKEKGIPKPPGES